MASATTQDLLKKINYIEADLEIQKQILFSIPSNQTEEMEKTVALIAEKTKEIEKLRNRIKEIDPDEYDRIMTFENAINRLRELASKTEFTSIISRDIGGECSLELKNGQKLECLIKACDKESNWVVITLDGELLQYPQDQVQERPPETTIQ